MAPSILSHNQYIVSISISIIPPSLPPSLLYQQDQISFYTLLSNPSSSSSSDWDTFAYLYDGRRPARYGGVKRVPLASTSLLLLLVSTKTVFSATVTLSRLESSSVGIRTSTWIVPRGNSSITAVFRLACCCCCFWEFALHIPDIGIDMARFTGEM